MSRFLALPILAATIFLAPTLAQAQGADLAITGIKVNGRAVPKAITLSATILAATKRIGVEIQNRGLATEIVADAATVTNLVQLQVTSLGACPDPASVLAPSSEGGPRFPIKLRSKRKVKILFHVTFDCANDPLQTLPSSPGHKDFTMIAQVTRSALPDGLPDTHPADDVCPRSVTPPFVLDPNPDGKIADKGCGLKKADKTYGDPLLLDVHVK